MPSPPTGGSRPMGDSTASPGRRSARNPREHAGVLAEARPQEAPSSPLRNQLTWKMRGSLRRRGDRSRASARSSRPCCSPEGHHREGVAAQFADRARGGGGPLGATSAPRNTPCSQSRASNTSGTLGRGGHRTGSRRSARPRGPPTRARSNGHCSAGTVKRALGWAAGMSDPESRGRRANRQVGAGGSLLKPSHHTSLSSVRAQLVKIASR